MAKYVETLWANCRWGGKSDSQGGFWGERRFASYKERNPKTVWLRFSASAAFRNRRKTVNAYGRPLVPKVTLAMHSVHNKNEDQYCYFEQPG